MMWVKTIILILTVLAVGVAFRVITLRRDTERTVVDSARERETPAVSSVVEITADRYDNVASDPKVFVVDVHTPEQPHLPNTDAVIPYDAIAANKEKFPQDTSTPILVYCRSGSMSKQASQELVKMGYTMVYNLTGGANEYRESHVSVDLTPSRIDLGTVVYGDVATAKAVLANNTPTSLTVTRVSTSCGCTKASAAQTQLAPHESTDIAISFDPAVHKDDTDVGDIIRTIYIDTNNPNFPRLTAELTANVVKRDGR